MAIFITSHHIVFIVVIIITTRADNLQRKMGKTFSKRKFLRERVPNFLLRISSKDTLTHETHPITSFIWAFLPILLQLLTIHGYSFPVMMAPLVRLLSGCTHIHSLKHFTNLLCFLNKPERRAILPKRFVRFIFFLSFAHGKFLVYDSY